MGGTHPIKVDIRIIATSNRNMLEAVKAQEFREDLYFRLNVVNINMPSLNHRMGDVEPLANYFIQKYCELNRADKKTLSVTALNALLTHQWTGNVRELENSMHRAVLMAQNEMIMPDDIFGQNGVTEIDSSGSGPILVGRKVAEVERELILHTVDHCLGNRTHAANILGISIRTLRNKLKEYSDTGHAAQNHP